MTTSSRGAILLACEFVAIRSKNIVLLAIVTLPLAMTTLWRGFSTWPSLASWSA